MTPIEPPPFLRHVFVYGTLRRGEERDINLLKPAPRYVGQARVAGVLFDLGDYPGLQLGTHSSNHTFVCGEVYAISPALEDRLDEVEGIEPEPNGEYLKRQVRVQVASGPSGAKGEYVCLVYEVAADRAACCSVITGGDWVAYRLQRRTAD